MNKKWNYFNLPVMRWQVHFGFFVSVFSVTTINTLRNEIRNRTKHKLLLNILFIYGMTEMIKHSQLLTIKE